MGILGLRLSCCYQLRKIYILCETFINTRLLPVLLLHWLLLPHYDPCNSCNSSALVSHLWVVWAVIHDIATLIVYLVNDNHYSFEKIFPSDRALWLANLEFLWILLTSTFGPGDEEPYILPFTYLLSYFRSIVIQGSLLRLSYYVMVPPDLLDPYA